MTIWFDVSTSSSWRRPVVGVVRTEREIVRHLIDEGVAVRFCVYSRDAHCFTEIATAEALASLHRDASPPVAQSAAPTPSVASKWDLVEQRARSLGTWGLASVQAGRSLYQGAKGVKAHMTFAARALLVPANASHSQEIGGRVWSEPAVRAPFQKGDVLISLGLDWHSKDLQDLAALRAYFGVRVLLFCYDLIPVKYPHLCAGDVAPYFTKYFVDLASAADHVMCISKCSQTDLNELWRACGTSGPTTSVVRLGCELPTVALTPESLPANLNVPFILFVSTIERRKNHDVLYKAYARLVDQGHGDALPLLVFAGMEGWGVSDLFQLIKRDPRVRDRILILNHCSDEQLGALYQACLFTVYPSLYEGWGLPVAESVGYGKYCLASEAASIPEIAGDALSYLHPYDVNAWAAQILTLCTDAKELRKREGVLKKKTKPDLWRATASAVFQQALALAGKTS